MNAQIWHWAASPPNSGWPWPHSSTSQSGGLWGDYQASNEEDTGPRTIKDANGIPLSDGDTVLLVKDLKVKGSSTVIKKGSKIKGIRLVYDNGDHDVDCKTEQGPFILKSEFLKKA